MSHSSSLTTPPSTSLKDSSLLYVRAVLAIVIASASHSLLYVISLAVAAHSARVITASTKATKINMDNDPEPVQEQKKEKSLNQ